MESERTEFQGDVYRTPDGRLEHHRIPQQHYACSECGGEYIWTKGEPGLRDMSEPANTHNKLPSRLDCFGRTGTGY